MNSNLRPSALQIMCTFPTSRLLIRCHFRADLCIPTHSPISRSISSTATPLESTMKKLTDSRQYQKVLDLFGQQSSIPTTSTALTLALKACTKLHDRERGIEIHRQLSTRSLEDPYVQTSLIHFYSKHSFLRDRALPRYFRSLLVQSRDVDRAEKIFSIIDDKTIFMYGAMFKGSSCVLHESTREHCISA